MLNRPEKKPDRRHTLRKRGTAVDPALRATKRRRAAPSCSREGRTNVNEGFVSAKSKWNTRCVTLWTVGHSTRSLDDFIALLQAHGIRRLVDVRTIPRSRHNPQFNKDQLPESLKLAGIQYVHIPALGGLRHARRDSVNCAWRNASFRGFADYMQTAEFGAALKELIRLARSRRTAIMCAEAVPWRCHRSLIADALLVRGVKVEEIASETATRPHTLTPWACVVGVHITYPAIPVPQREATPGS
jgi:protein tyrosine phosphatase (PTP) superfamily phosphohydrolase (DUF442 family)